MRKSLHPLLWSRALLRGKGLLRVRIVAPALGAVLALSAAGVGAQDAARDAGSPRLAQATPAPTPGSAPDQGDAQAGSDKNMPPDQLVKTVSGEVLDIIRKDREIQAGNQKKVIELVQDKVLPHFDFTRMTALAVGPGWRKATPEQQKLLIDQFRMLLVRTYSSGLSAYRNQVIEYKPLRANSGDTDVMVRSEVKQSSGQPVTIDYRMEKSQDGWKVYDVAIGGVSLVTTYRDSFGQEIRQHGIDGLIKALADKNRQLEQSQSARK